MKRRAIVAVCLIVVALGGTLFYRQRAIAPDSPSQKSNSTVQEIPGFDKKQYSQDDPASPWVVVNKKHPLPDSYAPKDLVNVGGGEQMRAPASQALGSLLASAKSQSVYLSALSGYRSYVRQVGVYNAYVKKDGQAAADMYSARPGHSEHQTGLAVDLGSGTCDLQICFGNTSAGKWLASHAHEYGFIIRYQKGQESLTGYQYEPWHIRYVGTDLSTQLKKTNQTLEQFFDLPNPANY